jgi:hypothetical protein
MGLVLARFSRLFFLDEEKALQVADNYKLRKYSKGCCQENEPAGPWNCESMAHSVSDNRKEKICQNLAQ